jgi:hypothetical protein
MTRSTRPAHKYWFAIWIELDGGDIRERCTFGDGRVKALERRPAGGYSRWRRRQNGSR